MLAGGAADGQDRLAVFQEDRRGHRARCDSPGPLKFGDDFAKPKSLTSAFSSTPVPAATTPLPKCNPQRLGHAGDIAGVIDDDQVRGAGVGRVVGGELVGSRAIGTSAAPTFLPLQVVGPGPCRASIGCCRARGLRRGRASPARRPRAAWLGTCRITRPTRSMYFVRRGGAALRSAASRQIRQRGQQRRVRRERRRAAEHLQPAQTCRRAVGGTGLRSR